MGRRGPDCPRHPSVTDGIRLCRYTLARCEVSTTEYMSWLLWTASVPAEQKRAATAAAIQYVRARIQGCNTEQIRAQHIYHCSLDSRKPWDVLTHMCIDEQYDKILVRRCNLLPNPARRLAHIIICYAFYNESKKMEQERQEEAAEAEREAEERRCQYVPGAEEMSGESCIIS